MENIINIETLPKRKEGIDWGKSVGCELCFSYNSHDGKLTIKKYDKKRQNVIIEYNNFEFKLKTDDIKKCKLGKLFAEPSSSKHPIIGVNDVKTLRPDIYEMMFDKKDNERYLLRSNKKIKIICPNCGNIKEISLNSLQRYGLGCVYCSDGISYGEKYIANLLKELNVEFINQLSKKHFSWCSNFRYDFYLPKYKCIIEVNGQQHYNKAFSTCGGESLENIIENDKIKKDLALKNDIAKYVIIKVEKSTLEEIKNSIIQNLYFLNLNELEWEKIEKMSRKSLVIEVCDLYNKGFSTKEIENVLKLSKTTVCRYLNSGTQMNICNYIGNDAATKHCKKSFTIEFEGNEYKFNSIVELYNQCNDLFGFQIGRAKLGYCVENDLIYKNIKFRKE